MSSNLQTFLNDYTVPYFELTTDEFKLPPPHFADLDGLLAVGGALSAENLLTAYKSGVYYWHHPLKRVQWWSPDPRIVLFPDSSMVNATTPPDPDKEYAIRFNEDFEALLRLCQRQYNDQEHMNPFWLSERMYRIFTELHKMGFAHSVEAWERDDLIGGIFGIALGNVFFGEYQAGPNSAISVILLKALLDRLREKGFSLLDMQKPSVYIQGVAYEEMARVNFVHHCREIELHSTTHQTTLT